MIQRTPNVQFGGTQHLKHTEIPRKDAQREHKECNFGWNEGKKKREILGPCPSRTSTSWSSIFVGFAHPLPLRISLPLLLLLIGPLSGEKPTFAVFFKVCTAFFLILFVLFLILFVLLLLLFLLLLLICCCCFCGCFKITDR